MIFEKKYKQMFLIHCLIAPIILIFLNISLPPTTASGLLTVLAILLLIVVFYQKVQNKDMIYQIEHDELTDLLSKRNFHEEIMRMVDKGQNIAVLFIDLDGFKQVNDTLGHSAGDLLLKNAASRIKRSVRPLDKAFRLGGDELAVIITNLNSETKMSVCTQIAERIVEQVGQPYCVDGQIAKVTCSVGIAFSSIDVSCNQLIKSADSAMYKAKRMGKNKFVFFKNIEN